MGYNVRCGHRHCRKRYVRRKHPDAYVRRHWAYCPACGGNLNVDEEVRRRHKQETCNCAGIPWPHRLSTITGSYFCHVHSLADVESVRMAKAMGGTHTRMRPDDPCPF